MATEFNYTPSKTINAFMNSNAFARFVVGPIGSGKTAGMIMEIVRRGAQQAKGADGMRRTRWVVIRNTLKQLRDTVEKDVVELLPPVAHYKVSDHTMYISIADVRIEMLFIPLETKEDHRRLLSTQLTGAWLAEFTELDYDIVAAVAGRLGRYPSKLAGGPTWHGMIGESNPGTKDSKWYKMLELELPKGWDYWKQAGGLEPDAENVENLPDNYYEKLMDGQSEEWVTRFVHAKWGDSLSGQAVFKSSFQQKHHIAENTLNPNPGRPLMIAQDFGRTPTSLICQVDVRGRLLVFKELTSEDMGLEMFLSQYLVPTLASERFRGIPVFVVGDPAGWHKSQLREESVADILGRVGFQAKRAATNDVVKRVRSVERIMLRTEGLLIDPNECPLLIKALKAEYKYRRKKDGILEDKPEKLHPWSDLADCLQYACLGLTSNLTGRVMRPKVQRQPAPPVTAWT